MPFPILGSNSAVAEFSIDNSARFNDDDNPRLSKTYGSEGNRKTFSISFWQKKASVNHDNDYLMAVQGSDDATNFEVSNHSSQALQIGLYHVNMIRTNRLFRDPSAWYHVMFFIDTTQASEANRFKLYINGVQETSFSQSNIPSQNASVGWGRATATRIGNSEGGTSSIDAYLSEFYYIDGQAKAPTDFGEFNDNGVWVPKEYEGTFGSNGIFLQFQDSSNLGDDTSGNGNDFSVSNLTATDQTTDTPTNNFATLNPLIAPPNQAPPTYSEGNTVGSINANDFVVSNFNLSNGKWYWEVKYTSESSNDDGMLGIVKVNDTTDWIHDLGTNNRYFGQNDGSWGFYEGDGNVYHNGSASGYGNSYTANDIIMFAMDLDNAKLYIGENGTWHNSGDPTSGATGTGAISIDSSSEYVVGASIATSESGSRTCGFSFNFGNPAFSISSSNTDGLYGNFEYSVPSGYSAICTKRLAEYG